MAVKISFKVGNHSRFKGSMEEGLEQFMTALGAEVAEKAEDNTRVDAKDLADRLSGRVARSLQAGMNFALKNMVGLKSAGAVNKGGAQPAKIYFDWEDKDIAPVANPKGNIKNWGKDGKGFVGKTEHITWKPLSSRTLKKKALRSVGGSGGKPRKAREQMKISDKAREYFRDTGALEGDLKRLSRDIVGRTGTVKVGYIKNHAKRFNAYRGNSQYITTGRLQITFMPKIPIRTLPGVQSGSIEDFDPNMLFESSLGLSSDSIKKLKNVSEMHHRPMLQPIFTFWMLNRVPRLVSGAIARSIKE